MKIQTELRPLLIVILIALPQQYSNGIMINNKEELKHWEIVLFGDVKEDWLFVDSRRNDVSLALINQSTMSLSTHLHMIFPDVISKSSIHGHVISIHSPKSVSDAVADLTQIQNFYKYNLGWKPYFFVRIPQELINFNYSCEQLLAELSLELPINSDVYLIFGISSNCGHVVEIYSLKNIPIAQDIQSPFMKDKVPAFYFETFLQRTPRRSNFHRTPITAVAMVMVVGQIQASASANNTIAIETQDHRGYELLVDFHDDNRTGNRFVGGLLIEEYWYLRDALNFSEAAIKGTGYVRQGPGGTLLGLALTINQGEADLGVSALEFLEFRAFGPHGVSYLHPIFHSPMLAFFKQPPVSSNRDIFISTLSSQVWLMLLGLWIAITISMQLTYKVYSKLSVKLDPKDLKMSQEISLWATGAVCQQSWNFTPCARGARTIFMIGWLSRFLCFTAFSASLVSILSFEVLRIHSFNDLLKEKFYIYNDAHIPSTMGYVEGLQARGQIPAVPSTLRSIGIEDAIGRLVESGSALITLSDIFYPIIRKEGYSDEFACNALSVVAVGARPVKMSMFVKKASPLREIFNTKILLMTERGVKDRMMRHYLFKTSVQCLKTMTRYHSSQSSKDVFTAYVILAIGSGLALTLGIVEKIFKKIWKHGGDNG